jgi:uncharacterized delta-60 repeat protein
MPNHGLVAAVATLTFVALALAGALSSPAAQNDKKLVEVEFEQAAVQPDGKVVAAGTTPYRTFVARFGVDGRLDKGFGERGIAWPELPESAQAAEAIAIGGSGEVTVSFSKAPAGESDGATLVRLNPEGQPDTGFGSNGVLALAAARAPSIAALPGGAVLVLAGVRSEAAPKDRLLRVKPDGSIDPGFEITSGSPDYGLGTSVQVGPDGKIYVATLKQAVYYPEPPKPRTQKQVVVSRFLPNGDPDPSFGKGGIAAFDSGDDPRPPGLQGGVSGFAVQPDGAVVVLLDLGGAYKTVDYGSRLLRVDGNGSSLTELARPGCSGQVAVGPDGTIYTAASSGPPVYSTGPKQVCFEGFGPSGATHTFSEADRVLALGPDGRVIVSGKIEADRSFASERFLESGTLKGPDRAFGLAFVPALGCLGRNPSIVAQATWTARDEERAVPTGPTRAIGTDGRDVIVGTIYNDQIAGNQGKDLICAGAGIDRVHGGWGPDRIYGGAGQDRLFGGPGRDRLFGGPGRDRIRQ